MPKEVGNEMENVFFATGYFWLIQQASLYSLLCSLVTKYIGDAGFPLSCCTGGNCPLLTPP